MEIASDLTYIHRHYTVHEGRGGGGGEGGGRGGGFHHDPLRLDISTFLTAHTVFGNLLKDSRIEHVQ